MAEKFLQKEFRFQSSGAPENNNKIHLSLDVKSPEGHASAGNNKCQRDRKCRDREH